MEIDCIVDNGEGETFAIEIKGGQTFNPGYLKNLKLFPDSSEKKKIKKYLIYQGQSSSSIKDIQIISWDRFGAAITGFI